MNRSRLDSLFYLAALLAVAGIAFLVVGAVSDDGPGRPIMIASALVAGAAGLALAGWYRVSRSTSALVEAEAARRRAAEAKIAEAEHEKQRVAEAKDEQIQQERAAQEQLRNTNSKIREWNRELRSHMVKLQRERGPLGDPHDVPAMVLQLAMTLIEAEKGLLLSRKDEGGDGDLDLLAAHGFDNDPEHSDLAQRFAREVIEQDTTLREDSPPEGSSPADREINCLVAIPIYVQDEFNGVVVCANRPGGFEEVDDEVLLALGDHTGAILNNARLRGDLRNAYVATVRLIADALEAKDPFLREHSDEVSHYVAAVADRLGMEPREREELLFGSLLHDVGKLGISERILLKPAELTPEERTVIELHPRIGYRLVQQVPVLQNIAPAILHHHERFDGTGYPQGLRAEQIPISARIICVADSFSAMTTERPYRGAMSVEEALAELERCAGEQFDPEVVRIFIEEVRKRPPQKEESDLAVALSDAELEVRAAGEPILGHASYAVTDNLTLLYSHRYFHEMARAEAQRAALQSVPFSIVMIELADIDRRNAEQGYSAGDEALKTAAAAVQRAAGRCSGFGCRYSGRKLALIAPRTDGATAARLADDIAAEVESDPELRFAVVEWRSGDDARDMVARARAELSGAGSAPPAPSDGSAVAGSTAQADGSTGGGDGSTGRRGGSAGEGEGSPITTDGSTGADGASTRSPSSTSST